MANTSASSVGNVYQIVIQETVNASQMDFQDSGVDPSTLDILRDVWQKKLSGMAVSIFPWDPPPPPPPAPVEDDKTNLGHMAVDGTRIKPEPTESQLPPPPPPPPLGIPLSNAQSSAARAAAHVQNMQSKIGNNANQNQQQHHQQQNRPHPQNGPMLAGGLMLPGLPQMRQQQNSGQIGGQTDGPGDFGQVDAEGDVVISQSDADSEFARVVAEGNSMRAQESALRKALDDLRVQSATMDERPVQRRRKHRARTAQPVLASSSSAAAAPALAQTDGPEDALDEDAINSDLDDTDEEPVDDEDEVEGAVPQIMLCMYDKVQRTKNKWKCVLKDGVMTVNGKEYVFHKANGEYEW